MCSAGSCGCLRISPSGADGAGDADLACCSCCVAVGSDGTDGGVAGGGGVGGNIGIGGIGGNCCTSRIVRHFGLFVPIGGGGGCMLYME